MASVDGSKSFLATSEELFDYVCGPCKTGGNIKEAKQYCGECSEYLCDSCVEYHPKLPSLKNHKIISATADKVSVGPDQSLTVHCGCNKTKHVEYYCEDHNEVICGLCKEMKHSNCQMPRIKQKSSTYTIANLESTISRAKSIKIKYDQLKKECNRNVKELKRSTENCKKEIKAFRKELDHFLDKLEQSILADLNQFEINEQRRNDRQIGMLTSALQRLDTDCQLLSDAKNGGRKDVMFATDIRTSKDLLSYERRLADLERDVRQQSISFEKNDKLNDVRNDITNLGTLKISEKNKVLFGQLKEPHRKVSVRLADDKHDPRITGFAAMYNDTTVICDFNNHKFKVLDCTLAVIDNYVMPDGPWDISVLDTNNVIVTIPYKQQLQEVQVFPKLKVGRVIQLDKQCWGVEVSSDKIYVSCRNFCVGGEVRVLDKHGNLERQLGVNKDGSFVFSVPFFITVSRTGDRIFVSDDANNTITCMTVDGSILYQYKDKDLINPSGLYCDDNNNILVCCYDSHKVQIITAEGKLNTTILSSKDGLQRPIAVTYRQKDNILVVGCFEGPLLVYSFTH